MALVLESLSKIEILSQYVNLDLNSLISERKLGLICNIENDAFTFKPVIKDLPDTKRGILSIVSSVFHPLGILNPRLIEAKYYTAVMGEKVDWDKPILTYLNKRWNLWKQEINSISTISVPRWFGFHPSLTSEIELHIYCDASQIAYGAVAYLRCLEENANQYSVSFVLSKSRLTPMKDRTLTIPKLELQAAVLATRLKVSILEQLKCRVHKPYFWTDSQITLKYIKNESKRFPIFVMNRLYEIRANPDTAELNNVPGEMNPADHCTRYTRFSQLMSQTTWIDGLKCLKYNSSFNSSESVTVDEENVSTAIEEHQVHIPTNNTKKKTQLHKMGILLVIPKVVRHISSIMRLKEKWINLKRKDAQKIDINLLTVAGLRKAEREI